MAPDQSCCQLLPSNTVWDPACSSPKTWDAQANGTYVFNVRVTDAADNVSASRTVHIDPADTIAAKAASRAQASAATGVGTGTNVNATFS